MMGCDRGMLRAVDSSDGDFRDVAGELIDEIAPGGAGFPFQGGVWVALSVLLARGDAGEFAAVDWRELFGARRWVELSRRRASRGWAGRSVVLRRLVGLRAA